jgi:Predicted metal-dependent membrane protease
MNFINKMNFLERALDKTNHFWKYILVGIIFFVSGLIGFIPKNVVGRVRGSRIGENALNEYLETMDLTLLGISQNMSMLLELLPLTVALFACILGVKYLHSRTFSETVNGTKKVRWNHAFVGFVVWFLLLSIYALIYLAISPDNFTFQFDIKSFLPLLLIVMLFTPLQTTCEEFLLRGYVTQGVAVLTKNRWLAVIIPGILFGLMHIANPEVSEYGFWVAMPRYIIFGLIFGLTAVLDDGIELAIGMHAANNIFVRSFVTSSTLAAPFHQHEVDMGVETIVLTIIGIIAIVFFARKYKWDFRVMNKKVEPLPSIEIEN